MPPPPAPDLDTYHQQLLAAVRRHLANPDPGAQPGGIDEAIDAAEQAATLAWEQAGGQPPLPRLLIALQAAAEEIKGLAAALAAGEGVSSA